VRVRGIGRLATPDSRSRTPFRIILLTHRFNDSSRFLSFARCSRNWPDTPSPPNLPLRRWGLHIKSATGSADTTVVALLGDFGNRSVILLAPSNRDRTTRFRNVWSDNSLHDQLQAEMQRLRGRIYLGDGAIRPGDLSIDGRHSTLADDQSWHLLLLDEKGNIAGCARYRVHPPLARFEDLGVATSALARSTQWASAFRTAVEEELRGARKLGFPYVEMGGWAIAEHFRGTRHFLLSVLASYAFVRLIPGAFAICPATERNGSAAVLRRMGGRLFEMSTTPIPAYFDARYGCQMQMLRFDARQSPLGYEENVQQLMARLIECPVICANPSGPRKTQNDFALPSHNSKSLGAIATAA